MRLDDTYLQPRSYLNSNINRPEGNLTRFLSQMPNFQQEFAEYSAGLGGDLEKAELPEMFDEVRSTPWQYLGSVWRAAYIIFS